jgi:uncharacterized alkaline shock family protein YloU
MAVANRQRAKATPDGSSPTVTEEDVRIPASKAGEVRGGVSIAESVVEMIAATAARTVPGIYPGSGPEGIVSEVGRAFGARQTGIRARIKHDREVSLEMRMAVEYGEHIPTRGEQVRVEVAKAVRQLTDLETREIKVKVTDVILPQGDQPKVGLNGRENVEEEEPEPAPVS